MNIHTSVAISWQVVLCLLLACSVAGQSGVDWTALPSVRSGTILLTQDKLIP